MPGSEHVGVLLGKLQLDWPPLVPFEAGADGAWRPLFAALIGSFFSFLFAYVVLNRTISQCTLSTVVFPGSLRNNLCWNCSKVSFLATMSNRSFQRQYVYVVRMPAPRSLKPFILRFFFFLFFPPKEGWRGAPNFAGFVSLPT